jgi:hypothetical protein
MMYLHEMKVLGYGADISYLVSRSTNVSSSASESEGVNQSTDAHYQQIKFAVPCVGGLDKREGMQWWKVDWIVSSLCHR